MHGAEVPTAPASRERVASNLVEELWFAEDDAELARDRAKASLAAQMALIQGLRPFPVAASRLIHLLADPDFEPARAVQALESDPALAAKTLSIANSPLFRTRVPCVSIRDAVRRLGARHLRDIAIGISAMSVFADAKGIGEAIRDHSVGVGAIARVLAGIVMPAEAQTLFLAGLLHDVGKLLLVQTGEVTYAEDEGEETDLRERHALGFDHGVLGGNVMRFWRIPDPIADLIAWHHLPSRAIERGGQVGVMAALLRSADRIDAALVDHDELDDVTLGELARDASWSYADLNVADLHGLWPQLRETRRETLNALAR